MNRKVVKVTDTSFRDAHQSLWSTRMRTTDMLPIAEKIDEIGYHSLEVWGGATFDVCMRYLNEDPWERLRQIRKHVKKTKLQMLLRGQNLLGYQHYPDDVVEEFIKKSVANGIDIIRIFDALNDIRNFETSVRVAKKEGAHVQGSVSYTVSPVHTLEHYVHLAKELKEMGVDSICIKDMAGLLTPYNAYDLVKALKTEVKLPVQLHCHYVGGLAAMSYIKAAEAGVDVIDTASAPIAFGSSQPPVETIVKALEETDYDTGLNVHKLFEVAEYFDALRNQYGKTTGTSDLSVMRVFEHQVPGGMYTNLLSQLKEQKALNKLDEVLTEIPKVRQELGYPPLVTPTSQIVGTQAVFNVLLGQRYKVIPGEVRNYVRGLYGKPPAAIDPKVQQKAIGEETPISCRPADLLDAKLEKYREEVKDEIIQEEDVLSYALFPQIALKFFKERREGRLNQPVENIYAVEGEEEGEMKLNEVKELIELLNKTDINELSIETEGNKIAIRKGLAMTAQPAAPVTEVAAPAAVEKPEAEDASDLTPITSPMVGTFYRAPAPDAPPFVEVGGYVEKGQTVCIVEAMKLMNEIEAEESGKIVKILVENGQSVEYGQSMFLIEEE